MNKVSTHSHLTHINLAGEQLILFPQKVLYWPKEKCLFLADLHLGKGVHFRSKGIPVPQEIEIVNLFNLSEVLGLIEVKRVCFLGDLFHSSYNSAWEKFNTWCKQYPAIQFDLILGNHDILDHKIYESSGLQIHQQLKLGPFLLSHEPLETTNGLYNLAGHIHPGVRLRGKGKQSHRLPCFFFGKTGGILPAFGQFTGLYLMDVKKTDRVYAITDTEVFSFPS